MLNVRANHKLIIFFQSNENSTLSTVKLQVNDLVLQSGSQTFNELTDLKIIKYHFKD